VGLSHKPGLLSIHFEKCGKMAAYEALSEDGRFSDWLQIPMFTILISLSPSDVGSKAERASSNSGQSFSWFSKLIFQVEVLFIDAICRDIRLSAHPCGFSLEAIVCCNV
jgi:hypothetical protein